MQQPTGNELQARHVAEEQPTKNYQRFLAKHHLECWVTQNGCQTHYPRCPEAHVDIYFALRQAPGVKRESDVEEDGGDKIERAGIDLRIPLTK